MREAQRLAEELTSLYSTNRCVGHTSKLIENLDSNCTLIVANKQHVKYMNERDELDKNVEVMTLTDIECGKWRGRKLGPVILDHYAWEIIVHRLCEDLDHNRIIVNEAINTLRKIR